MTNNAPGYATRPDHAVLIERHSGRHRVVVAGETVADSRTTLLVRETGRGAVHYFPLGDVRQDLLRESDRHTHCPFKGDACYWNVEAAGRTVENAVWGYPKPFDEARALAGHVAFDKALVEEFRFGN